ncbi:cell division protein FtsQ/DivIB [Actinotalea sp.]|uniref:cell division protein FtsQ/DivIB n=1 Tax=Actinotalea sp. TaxID=1872145 RepID=UPI00356390EF
MDGDREDAGSDLAAWQAPRSWSPRRAPVVSTGSAARFAERTAHRRRLLRDRLLLAGGGSIVLAALAWLLLASPVLALHVDEIAVEVEGTGTTVDPAAVLAVAQSLVGTPLPRLDTVAVRRDILDVPGVRAATVTRVWPHGVQISVVARDPVAAVPAEDGGLVLVDQDGVQVGRTETAPEGLPVISVPLDGDTRAMTAVLVVLQQIPEELAAEVQAVAASNRDAVTLTLRDGAVVEWGSADESALKARVLTTLRAAPSSAGVRVFDVSAPTLPITRS